MKPSEMTELEELRRWSAGVMGWEWHKCEVPNSVLTDEEYYIKPDKSGFLAKNWRPDDPTTGQIWMVVERMRKKQLYLKLTWLEAKKNTKGSYMARFLTIPHNDIGFEYRYDPDNPCLAILLAAKAAWRDDD